MKFKVNFAPKLYVYTPQPWCLDAYNIVAVVHNTGEQQTECFTHVQFTSRFCKAKCYNIYSPTPHMHKYWL